MSTTALPAGMMRMMNGRIVPVGRSTGQVTAKTKKLLLVVQFYEGDRDAAEELALLIADLERTRNHEADIMLMRRADCRELSPTVKTRLESKFGKVLPYACRRNDAKGYPMGSNQMFCDLVTLMAQYPPWKDDYYAFANLETDCVPTRPGWIGELIAAWKAAKLAGKSIIGHFCTDPHLHLNGLAVYDAGIYNIAGGKYLLGCSPTTCYDIAFTNFLLPHAVETPLIYFKYRQPTITPSELFSVQRDGIEPALYHGVKDDSARRAVREHRLNMTPRATPAAAPAKRQNVYTYSVPSNDPDMEAVLKCWRDGWTTRGWNPVVLTATDAAKHPRFSEFQEAVMRLPTVFAEKEVAAHCYYRWLALASAGGGLLTDNDVLPEEFTPSILAALIGQKAVAVFRPHPDSPMVGMYFSKEEAETWVDQIIFYDAQPDDLLGGIPHVTDDRIARRGLALHQFTAPLVSFATPGGDGRRSVAMQRFLRGEDAPATAPSPAPSIFNEAPQAFAQR